MPIRLTTLAPRSRNEALDLALDQELKALVQAPAPDGAEKAEGLALAEVRRGPWFVRPRGPVLPKN